MRYGYRHVPEKIEQEVTEKKPMQINLTGVTATGASVEPAKSDDADAEGDSPDTRH